MPELISVLRKEHDNIASLLGVLRQELAIFDEAGPSDYEVMEGIAEYFLGFPDRYHHPKEDLILTRMKERDPAWEEAASKLAEEHQELAALARNFQQAVHNVLNETDVPRSAFHRVVMNFVDRQSEHLRFEEEVFFPAALEVLTDADWAEIAGEMPQETDPLFDDAPAEGFESLRRRILRWEEENATARTPAQPQEPPGQ